MSLSFTTPLKVNLRALINTVNLANEGGRFFLPRVHIGCFMRCGSVMVDWHYVPLDVTCFLSLCSSITRLFVRPSATL